MNNVSATAKRRRKLQEAARRQLDLFEGVAMNKTARENRARLKSSINILVQRILPTIDGRLMNNSKLKKHGQL